MENIYDLTDTNCYGNEDMEKFEFTEIQRNYKSSNPSVDGIYIFDIRGLSNNILYLEDHHYQKCKMSMI